MRKGDIVEKIEFESIIDPIRNTTTVKKFNRVRKCVQILKGRVNPLTKIMEYVDISTTVGVDLVKLDDPKAVHDRYVITYDNISETEIP